MSRLSDAFHRLHLALQGGSSTSEIETAKVSFQDELSSLEKRVAALETPASKLPATISTSKGVPNETKVAAAAPSPAPQGATGAAPSNG